VLARHVLLTIIGRFGLAALIFATDVAIARAMGPSAKGRFTLVLLYSQLAALVVGIGLDNATGYLAGRSAEAARKGFANALIWTAVIGGIALVGSVAAYGMPDDPSPSGPLTQLLPNLTGAQFLFAALAIPGELLFAVGLMTVLGRGEVGLYNGLRLLRRGVMLALIFATAATARMSLDVALLLNLVALVVSAVAIILAATAGHLRDLRPAPAVFGEQVSFGLRSVIGAVAERLQFRADSFIVNIVLGVRSTGIYSVASGIAETLWYLPNALGLVMFSRAVDPKADAGRVAAAMTRTTLALTAVLAIPVFILAPTLVEVVYGPGFVDAGYALRAMLPGIVAYSVVAILSRYVVGRGNPGLSTAVLLAGLAVNVALNLFLIPRLGIMGAAIASSLSYFVTAAFTVAAFRSLSGHGLRETLLVQPADVRLPFVALRDLIGRVRRWRPGPAPIPAEADTVRRIVVEEHDPGDEF
jgi:O-antigen/teichoic acid export membrane protein